MRIALDTPLQAPVGRWQAPFRHIVGLLDSGQAVALFFDGGEQSPDALLVLLGCEFVEHLIKFLHRPGQLKGFVLVAVRVVRNHAKAAVPERSFDVADRDILVRGEGGVGVSQAMSG